MCALSLCSETRCEKVLEFHVSVCVATQEWCKGKRCLGERKVQASPNVEKGGRYQWGHNVKCMDEITAEQNVWPTRPVTLPRGQSGVAMERERQKTPEMCA